MNGKGLRGAVVLETLGAAAGISAFVAFVGGALMWLRLDELGLPADRMVAELPAELLLTLGANTLIVPAIVGLVATIVLYALPKWTKGLIAWGAFVAAGAATFAIWDAIADVPVGWRLLAPGLAAVAVGLAARALVRRYCDKILSDDRPLRRVWLTAFVMGA
nr:hypothetical protein [Actinomycetota bacterium]